MTGYRFSFLRHDCATCGCYIDQLPCWDELIECFPRKIRPTDVDGFIEIGGRFLFLEEKRAGVSPDAGQRRALRLLASLPGVTVVFFRPTALGLLDVLIYDGTPPLGFQTRTRTAFFDWLRAWVRDADEARAHGQ